MELVSTDSLKAAREVIQLFSWKDIGKAENLFCFPCGESSCPSEELQMQKSYVHTMHRSRISEVSKIKPELFQKRIQFQGPMSIHRSAPKGRGLENGARTWKCQIIKASIVWVLKCARHSS